VDVNKPAHEQDERELAVTYHTCFGMTAERAAEEARREMAFRASFAAYRSQLELVRAPWAEGNRCTVCGAALEDDRDYCHWCGKHWGEEDGR